MTDPRWTVEEDRYISYGGHPIFAVLADPNATPEKVAEMRAALVAAVRDHALLRRVLAEYLHELPGRQGGGGLPGSAHPRGRNPVDPTERESGRQGSTVTDPRWTIEGSVLMWWAQGDERGPSLHQRDLGAIWDALPDDVIVEAYDALVAAVRDAELLRQARELAQSVRLMQSQDRRREAIAQADDLLDLLSPVADSGDQSEVESPRAAGIAHRDETGHDMAVIDNHKSSCAECDWSAEKRT